MAADYKLPLTVNKFVRFFDGQFLQDQDFIDEQKYQLSRQNWHNRVLHVGGVAQGLTVYKPANSTLSIRVRDGVAIDAHGRHILLAKHSAVITMPDDAKGGTRYLYIAYHQVPDDLPSTSQGVEEETRWRDEPYIFTSSEQLGVDDTYDGPDWNGYLDAGPPPPVLLAKLTVADNGSFTIDETVRQYSGLRLPGPNVAAPTLRSDSSGRVGLWMVDKGSEVEKLTVTSDGRLGLNTTSPSAAFEIKNTLTATSTAKTLVGLKVSPTFNNDGKTGVKRYGLLVESGWVGIGTTTPATNFEVRGVARAGSTATKYTEISHGGSHGYINVVGVGRLDFRHEGTNKMVLTDGSKLGIGHDAPGAHVDVMGVQNNTSSISLQLRAGNSSGNYNSSQIAFGYNNSATYRHAIKSRHNSGNQFGNALDFYVWKHVADNEDAKDSVGGVHTMTLDGGRVGIGNTNPGLKLDVSGDARFLRGGKEVVFTSGNFGNNNSTDLFFNKGNVGFNQSEFVLYNNNNNNVGNRYFQLQYSEDDAGGLTIRKGGNVGIGNMAPTETLDVSGTARITGNVGIGQAATDDALAVTGKIRATDGLYMDMRQTAPQSSAGWHRIMVGADKGARNSGIFEIRWGAAGRHGHVRFAVSANYGFDDGAQLTVLDQSSYSGRIVPSIRLLMKDTYDLHYVEFYYNGNKSGNNAITFTIVQLTGFGWSLIDPIAGTLPADYTAHEVPANVMFAAKSGANGTSLFQVDNNGRVKSGTLYVGKWPSNDAYVFFGTSELDQSNSDNYALLQASTTSSAVGRTYLNSPVDIRFRITNNEKMILASNGNVGIGTTDPATLLTLGNGTNRSLLRFNTARAWEFTTSGSGSGTGLQLKALSNGKNFQVVSSDGTVALNVNTADGGGKVQSRIWYSGEYTWNQGNDPVRMGPTDRTVAFLTYVRGQFEGHGEYVEVYAKDGYWYLGGNSAKSSVRAKARCIGMNW